MNPWDMLVSDVDSVYVSLQLTLEVHLQVVTNEFYFSDWLFLYYLARNMEPYLFRQMLIDHIIPEIQSVRSSMKSLAEEEPSEDEAESDKLKESEAEEDEHSLNSEDMEIVPPTSLVAVNEKRVKFAWGLQKNSVIWYKLWLLTLSH